MEFLRNTGIHALIHLTLPHPDLGEGVVMPRVCPYAGLSVVVPQRRVCHSEQRLYRWTRLFDNAPPLAGAGGSSRELYLPACAQLQR